jgi:hypothetical protein
MVTQWIPASEAWAHVAFYERDKAQGKIFAKLAEGKVLAWAEFYTFDNAEHRGGSSREIRIRGWRRLLARDCPAP